MDPTSRIPITVSARHVHLCQEHVQALFGPEYRLTEAKPLRQPGQFACQETVDLVGPRRTIERVRVLGPERGATQVEISRTDEITLGIDAPIRGSGKLDDTPGLTLRGPAGEVALDAGVIQALRHIHMTPEDAERFGVRDRDWVMVRVGGARGVIFDDVLVRVSPSYALEMHLDTDEANAADLGPDATGQLMRGSAAVAPDPTD